MTHYVIDLTSMGLIARLVDDMLFTLELQALGVCGPLQIQLQPSTILTGGKQVVLHSLPPIDLPT